MVSVTIDRQQIVQLRTVLGDASKAISRELAMAVNATAKKTRLDMGRTIRGELKVTKKVAESTLKIQGKATTAKPKTVVRLGVSERLPLRDFGAKQNKVGVRYRVSPKTGSSIAPGAFQGPRPGAVNVRWRGRVFKRKGKARLPIIQLHGASPWGAFVVNKQTGPQVVATQAELRKQIQKRINYQIHKAAGTLRGRQKT